MDILIKYRGLGATSKEVEFIKKLILANPGDSRRALSQKLCRAWNWLQPNGALKTVWGYPLTKHFRKILQNEQDPKIT